jgi:ABC-type phosphate/phosphonate transport system substrate-binding protein
VIASLGMYPFAHLRDAYDSLWHAIRRRLSDGPDELDLDVDLHDAWRRSDLLLGQTCGWPLVSSLSDQVAVIGAFDVVAPFAAGGRYRSVLVAAKPLGIEQWKADRTAVVAQNGPDSLSGWISMQWAWGGAPPNVMTTGSHVASMRAVASGAAQVASIDALTFEFFAESEPAVAGHLHVIGHGPVVPSLPLVTSTALADRVDEVRSAIADAVADPSMAAVCRRLRIRGLVPFELADYEPLRELLPTS